MRFLKWSIIGVRWCWPLEHAQCALQLYFNKRLRNLMHQGLLLVMLLQRWDLCPHQFEIDAPSFWDVGHVLNGTKIIVATQSIWVFIFFSINFGHYHWHCVVFGTLWFTSPLSSWHAFLHIMFFFVTLHDLNKDIKTFNVFSRINIIISKLLKFIIKLIQVNPSVIFMFYSEEYFLIKLLLFEIKFFFHKLLVGNRF